MSKILIAMIYGDIENKTMFSEMSEAEKRPWVAKCASDKARYQQELEMYHWGKEQKDPEADNQQWARQCKPKFAHGGSRQGLETHAYQKLASEQDYHAHPNPNLGRKYEQQNLQQPFNCNHFPFADESSSSSGTYHQCRAGSDNPHLKHFRVKHQAIGIITPKVRCWEHQGSVYYPGNPREVPSQISTESRPSSSYQCLPQPTPQTLPLCAPQIIPLDRGYRSTQAIVPTSQVHEQSYKELQRLSLGSKRHCDELRKKLFVSEQELKMLRSSFQSLQSTEAELRAYVSQLEAENKALSLRLERCSLGAFFNMKLPRSRPIRRDSEADNHSARTRRSPVGIPNSSVKL
mmetsp:Transcript_25129/g.49175  ORF Transcript_25129/g.49175 Transcript_25129/m.49175 type:complete len:347 (-) Transcript_25129:165-1205(-)